MSPSARLSRVSRLMARRGGRSSVPPHLALNLSFVLHERSDSDAVLATSRAAASHQQWTLDVDRIPSSDLVIDGFGFAADSWLTATLGLPRLLPDALHDLLGASVRHLAIDGEMADSRLDFFRAPATLVLDPALVRVEGTEPSGNAGGGNASVGVAALIARPGRRSAQLIIRGPYDLPRGLDPALRQMESLIQSYADQWMPTSPLWDAPAEVLLPDEIR